MASCPARASSLANLAMIGAVTYKDGSVKTWTWDRGRIIYIDRRDTCRRACARPLAGTATPLDDSAASKVLLASRPSEEVKTLWCDGLVHTRHASHLVRQHRPDGRPS